MLLEFITLAVVVGFLTKLLLLKYDHWRFSHLPGPPRKSFFYGNAEEFQKRLLEEGAWGAYWLDLVREHGIIFHCFLMMKPRVFVADPLVIKEMVTDFKTFPRADDDRGFIAQRFSFSISRMGTTRYCGFNSILTDLGGPIWKRKKKIMDPAFSIQRLTKHLSKFYDIAVALCDAIEAAQQKSPDTLLEVTSIMSPYTIDAISRAGFSANEEQTHDLRIRNIHGRNALTKITTFGGNTVKMMTNADARKALFLSAEMIQQIRDIGKQMIIDRTSNGKFGQADDVLDVIIGANMDETNGQIDVEESLDDFMTMYIAGNATTSTTLLWSLGQLTRNPDAMEKLVEEIDSVWTEACIDGNSDVSLIGDTLKKMPYMEAVVKETLRCHPPVQFIIRKCAKQVKLCGYDIPSDTVLLSGQGIMHHWEKYWDEPEKFQPERFIKSSPKPYTYIPFFLGPRQCIGKNFAILELKCMLCELLSRFEIERDPNGPWKQKSGQAVLCYPKENMYTFKPRL